MSDDTQQPITATGNTTIYFTELPGPKTIALHNADYNETIYKIAVQHAPSRNPEAVKRYMKAFIKMNAVALRNAGVNLSRPNIHKVLPFTSYVLPNPSYIDENAILEASRHSRFVNRMPREDREKLHDMINNNVDINTFNSAAI